MLSLVGSLIHMISFFVLTNPVHPIKFKIQTLFSHPLIWYNLIMSEFEIEVLALIVLASCWLLWHTIGYSIREAIKERKNERK